VFQLAAPTLLWVMEWTACQWNSQPFVPDPTPASSNWEILDAQPSLEMITLGPDGSTPLYRVSGVYVYACLQPSPTVWQDVIFGRPPWMDATNVSRTMPLGRLIQDLGNINSNSTGTGDTL
jgi:hypothetical protein